MNHLSLTSISSATWDIAPYNHETCVCTYFLPEVGEVQIWTNPIGQLHGVWKKEGKSNSISIEDIEGVPIEARLDSRTLEAFLKDTYLRLKDKSNPLMGIRIMTRLKGGGNSFSSFGSHSQHAQQPPPVARTPFNYSFGFPIRHLSCPPVAGGEFIETQGGLNDKVWSTIYKSQDPNVAQKVRVTIHVWKKDFHANRINELSALKNRAVQDLTSKNNELGSIEAKVNKLSNDILLQQSNLERLTKELTEVSAENQRISIERSEKKRELEQANYKFKEEETQTRSLIDFLSISETMGFPLNHRSIDEFQHIIEDVSRLITSERSPNNLFTKILAEWPKVEEEAIKAEGQKLVVVSGPTGVGKSSMVNHLLGLNMEPKKIDGELKATTSPGEEIAKIGHRTGTSETLFTQVCSREQSPFTIADSGGFYDTRGVREDIIISASLKRTIERSSSTRFLFCVFVKDLLTRGSDLTKKLNLMLGDLLKDYKNADNSFALILTQPPMKSDKLFSTQDALSKLNEILADIKGTPEEPLYQFILRDGGKYVHVYNPFEDSSRDAVYQMLNAMEPIENPANIIGHAYTQGSIVAVMDEATRIAQRVNKNYNDLLNCQKAFSSLDGQANVLKEKEEKLKEQIMEIERKILAQKNEEKTASITVKSLQKEKSVYQQSVDNIEEELVRLNTDEPVIYSKVGTNDWIITGA